MVPIHRYPELIPDTVNLINSEWPRSLGARLWSLESSKDSLPTCLVLTQLNDPSEDSDKQSVSVLAHLKLTLIPSKRFACFVVSLKKSTNSYPIASQVQSLFKESVVVWKDLRGLGIGSHIMREAESYCKCQLKLEEIYLSTTDKEDFYKKLGYEICDPISIYGGASSGVFKPVTKKKYMKKSLYENEREDSI